MVKALRPLEVVIVPELWVCPAQNALFVCITALHELISPVLLLGARIVWSSSPSQTTFTLKPESDLGIRYFSSLWCWAITLRCWATGHSLSVLGLCLGRLATLSIQRPLLYLAWLVNGAKALGQAHAGAVTQFRWSVNISAESTHIACTTIACKLLVLQVSVSPGFSDPEEYRRLCKPARMVQCNFCPYSTTARAKMTLHVRTHTGEKPFQCRYCAYTCARKGQLVVHERQHTGEKPFKCETCGYASTNRGDLIKHQRLHTGDKPFMCHYCSYRSTQRSNLTVHEASHKRNMFLWLRRKAGIEFPEPPTWIALKA